MIKLHPERGRELLNELGGFDETVARLVLDHHERLDGSGYPRGVEGAELDLETRILAVCDVYDALVSPRVYRAGLDAGARARPAPRGVRDRVRPALRRRARARGRAESREPVLVGEGHRTLGRPCHFLMEVGGTRCVSR